MNEVWITKDGKEIKLSNMEISHLVNCRNFLIRRIKKKEYKISHMCVMDISEGPCYYCDENSKRLIVWQNWIKSLEEEINRRKV